MSGRQSIPFCISGIKTIWNRRGFGLQLLYWECFLFSIYFWNDYILKKNLFVKPKSVHLFCRFETKPTLSEENRNFLDWTKNDKPLFGIDTFTKVTTSSVVSIFWRKTIVFENKAKKWHDNQVCKTFFKHKDCGALNLCVFQLYWYTDSSFQRQHFVMEHQYCIVT